MSNPYLDDATAEAANPYLDDAGNPPGADNPYLDAPLSNGELTTALAQQPQVQRISPIGDIAGQPDTALLSAVKSSLTPNEPTPQELREAEFAKRAGVEPIPLGTRIAAGLDTGIRQGMATPGRLAHGAADLVLGAVGAGDTKLGRWNADMLRQYAEYENRMQAKDVQTFGPNDIANQVASGTGRALAELPLYIAPGMGAANAETAVARSAAAGGVVGGGTQYAQDRAEGRGRLDAATYATASGLITAMTTRAFGATGAESVFRKEGIQGIKNRLLAVLKDAGMEGAEEMTDQVQQDILERYSRNPEKPFDATVKEVLMAGAIGGLVGGGVEAGKLTAESASNVARNAGDFLTVRNPETEMLGNPLENIAPPAEGTDQTGFVGVETALNRALKNRATEAATPAVNPYLDESSEAQPRAQTQVQNSRTPAAEALQASASASQSAKVRQELEALPGAREDLRRTVPALTVAQTDAGLQQQAEADDAPVTKGDLRALVNFFQRGGPNPFAVKPADSTTENTEAQSKTDLTDRPGGETVTAAGGQATLPPALEVLPKVPDTITVKTPNGNRIVRIGARHVDMNPDNPVEINTITMVNPATGAKEIFPVPSGRKFPTLDDAGQAGFDLVRAKFPEVTTLSGSVGSRSSTAALPDDEARTATAAQRTAPATINAPKIDSKLIETANAQPEVAPKASQALKSAEFHAAASERTAKSLREQVARDRQNLVNHRAVLSNAEIISETKRIDGFERDAVRIEKQAEKFKADAAKERARLEAEPDQFVLPEKQMPVGPAVTQPLTETAPSATTEVAAPATSTVRSGESNPTNERQRGRVLGNPGMTAEAGSNPALGAAAISSPSRTSAAITADLRTQRQIVQQFQKAQSAGRPVNAERLSRAQNKLAALQQEEKAKTKELIEGRRGKRSSNGTDRSYDIIDAAEEHIGGKISWKLIKEANPHWKPTGAARKIFAATGEPADTAAQTLSERGIYKGDPGQVDQFGDAMNAAANARAGARKQAKTEKGVIAEEIALNQKFHKDIQQATKRTEPIVANDLNEGDEFTLKGAKLRVTALGFDGAGNVTSVTLDDGKQYGTQTVDGETTLRMDKGSPDRAEEAPKAKADPVLDALDKLKVDTRGTVQAFGLLPEAWNTLIDLVKLGVRAGRSLRDAIGWATSKFKERNPDAQFDEQGATDYLLTSDSPDAGQLREQFADERDKSRFDDARAEAEAEQVLSRKNPTKGQALAEKPASGPAEESEMKRLQGEIAMAEKELMDAIRQTVLPPDLRQGSKKDALAAKDEAAAKLRRLLAEQLKLMTSANVDAARSPEQTADLISQTVDLLNSIQDEISARTAKSQEVPADLTKLRQDLQTRLNLLKGWTNDQVEAESMGAGREAESKRDARMVEFESATNPEQSTLGQWWDKLKLGLRHLTSPIPELPLRGEQARKSALFRRGYRLFAVENDRVQKEAADKVRQVVEPLTKLGRDPQDNAALKQYFRLGEALQRAKMDEGKQKQIRAKMAEVEKRLNQDPFNLFRRLVLYRDLWWRGTYLKNEDGKPITLPMGLTVDDVRGELRRLTAAISEHKDGLAITEALRRHYALTDELQKSILDHGEIIPESLRNPLYFPHHIIDSWRDSVARVKPTTEEDFRKYLITPTGSGKLIQSDYLKAMYLHTADVLAHNSRVDLVDKYWKPYDISEQLKAQHGAAWNKPWNVPPGYKLFTPYKKLPLRMDYILSREVLADKLGVLFNDGDLRERLGEAGKVLKVKPEDLHAALVAGEKIQWALPAEIADALNGIAKREGAAANPGLGHAIGLPFRKLNSFWKGTKLFAPWNWIRYEYGNLSTDAIDKVLAADPGAARYLSRAASEVWQSGDQDFKASPEFAAAQREGVFDTVTAGESGKLMELPAFKEFLTPGEKNLAMVKNILGGPARGSKFREATFRYANFLANLERLRAGKEPVYAGAFHGDIEALGEDVDGQRRMLEGDELNYAKAAEISLKTFGDYNSLGVAGQWLRQYAVPFWSWQDVNFRYHANQLRNLADGMMGKAGDVGTARKAALRYAAIRTVSTLIAVGLAKELWNQFGGPALGLWDDDDDLESKLSPADRRRGHILLGKDDKGQAKVVYTPSAWSDVAEWIGGQNMKRLFIEYARGQITLDQVAKDYAKQLGPDVLNKLGQSGGPLLKAPYEAISGKSTFPDITDQRSIPGSEKWWRFVSTMTDDRIVNSLRSAFDKDYYSQPAAEQLQQIILQVRRRDPEQWAYYEVREDAADWKEQRTGKRSEGGAYDAPEAMALRNFRKAIYRADVVNAERFYNRLLDYGYTAPRLEASIRSQHPLADLSEDERKAFVAGLSIGQKRELDLATKYYSRFSALDGREKWLFPKKAGWPAQPDPALLRSIIEDHRKQSP